jgi:hypothetical protein
LIFKKGIEMRYKRVSNFNKHDSQEAFVIEKQKQGFTMDEIVVELRNNYNELLVKMEQDFPDYYDKYEGWFIFGFVIELKN